MYTDPGRSCFGAQLTIGALRSRRTEPKSFDATYLLSIRWAISFWNRVLRGMARPAASMMTIIRRS